MSLPSTSRPILDGSSDSLEVRLLGVVDFDAALYLQERLARDISSRTDKRGALLLCEHPPIITVGYDGSRADICADKDELISRQIEVRWLSRGGGCVFHVPGQLAVYPIVPLDRLGVSDAQYQHLLEQSMLDVCREMRIVAERRHDAPGIWCRSGRLAQLGVEVRSRVAYHGLFVNVTPDMLLQRLLLSPHSGERMTSLSAQQERFVSMHKVRESLLRHLAARLGYQQYHLHTGHPLLTRTRRNIYVDA